MTYRTVGNLMLDLWSESHTPLLTDTDRFGPTMLDVWRESCMPIRGEIGAAYVNQFLS
jgi:hypothetical protein